jgi:hypothetical protein
VRCVVCAVFLPLDERRAALGLEHVELLKHLLEPTPLVKTVCSSRDPRRNAPSKGKHGSAKPKQRNMGAD